MEGSVSRQEGDLCCEGPAALARLTGRLSATDHDIPQRGDAVGPGSETPGGGQTTGTRGKVFTEGQDVRGPVFPPVTAIQVAHRGVVDERERDDGPGRNSVRLRGGQHRAAGKSDIGRRIAADEDPQRAAASRCGRRAMRSSGYGIRSW